MKSVPLTAYPRTLARRGGVKKLRATGRVPAVIYGRKTQPKNLEIRSKELEDLMHHAASENLLVDLAIDQDPGTKRLALVQEIQHHPLSGQILHVDLHEVSADEKVVVQVPVETIGDCVGVKAGGVIEHVLFKVRVRALPKDLPEFIEIDVTNLEIGQAVHIGEIKAPPGVEVLGDKHISVVAVAAPVTEEQAAAEEAAAEAVSAGDVEMIKEKKEEGEAGAAPAAKGAPAAAKGADKGAAAAKPGEKAPAAADKAAEKKPAEKKK